jgi:Fe-S oxidoreductase
MDDIRTRVVAQRSRMNHWISDLNDIKIHMDADKSGALKKLYFEIIKEAAKEAKAYSEVLNNTDGVEDLDD